MNGAPVLVLLPGLGGTGDMFAPLLETQAGDVNATVIAYPPDRFLDYERLTVWVRERLPQDRPFVLLAESFSGPIGISIAADAPSNLRGLILCCTFARFPEGLIRRAGRVLPYLPVTRPPHAILDPILMGRWRTPALSKALRGALARVDPAVLRARALAALSVDKTSLVASISVPTLSLAATEDRLVPQSAQAHLLRSNPGIDGQILEGPHFLLQCNPEGAAREIRRFLAETENA